MKLKYFQGLSTNKPAFVCGLGPSTDLLTDSIKTFVRADMISIGVNDIGRHFTPEITLIVDDFSKKEQTREIESRIEVIKQTASQYIFIPETGCGINFERNVGLIPYFYERVKEGVPFSEIVTEHALPIHKTSIIPALGLALYMKCDPIYVLGFDLAGNHPLNNRAHIKSIDAHCKTLVDKIGVKIYNLSPWSKISAFPVVSMEKMIMDILEGDCNA